MPLNQSRDLKMSDACTIRVKNLGGSRVEVSCIGHGKQVHKGAYTLMPPQWLVLGGNGTRQHRLVRRPARHRPQDRRRQSHASKN